MSANSDKRLRKRLPGKATVFIDLLPAAGSTPGTTPVVICNSLDISTHGLRVCVDLDIEAGTILQLGLELPEMGRTLYLVGEVRWSQPAADNHGYWIGFQLIESDGTDIQNWISLLDDVTQLT